MSFKLPASFFPHNVIYIEKQNVGSWKPEDEEQRVVSGVKFSHSDGLIQSNDEIKKSSGALLYVSPDWSSFTDFKAGNLIEHNGTRYSIARINTYSQPTSSNTHHWRLELV